MGIVEKVFKVRGQTSRKYRNERHYVLYLFICMFSSNWEWLCNCEVWCRHWWLFGFLCCCHYHSPVYC